MRRFINHKMTFSGNSAHYSPELLKEQSPVFNNLRLVEFSDDETVAVYHYGEVGMEQIDDLKSLGSVLVQPMIIHGFDYTDNRPVVVVISWGKVYFSHTTPELASTHPAIVNSLRKNPHFKVRWNSHYTPKARFQSEIPKIINVFEPNCEFDLEDE